MKKEKIFDGITGIREDIIERAENYSFEKKEEKKSEGKRWKKWAARAAGFCLFIGAGLFLLNYIGGNGGGGTHKGDAGESGTVFMSYAGPVLPLTTISDATGITVERNIDFDFSPYKIVGKRDDYSYSQLDAYGYPYSIITDDYILNNSTNEDITLTALYGFVGSFRSKIPCMPKITINGTETETDFYAGRYTGSFQSAYGVETDKSDKTNLLELSEWQRYETLLSKNDYMEDALAEYPQLNQKVIIYRLSELAYTGEDDSVTNPSMDVCFTMDEKKTTFLTWGSSGGVSDLENNIYHRSFDVLGEGEDSYLLVIGEDIENLAMQGCRGIYGEGKELEGVTAKLERYEAVLGDVIWEILIEDRDKEYEKGTLLEYISDEILYGSIAKLFYDYGILSDAVVERCDFGALEDLYYSENAYMTRVMYVAFEVTIPANGSVTIDAMMFKNGSYDFYGKAMNRHGYDMMTSAGSVFTFLGQSASISNTECIKLVGQNFGFDLENGITEVELDINEPHYYLEVYRIED